VITLDGPYRPGSPLDAGFIAFPLLCGAAALHPSMAVVATAAPTGTMRPGWRLALLGGAAILAPAVQMVEWLRGRPIEVPVVAAGSIVMFLLIVARTPGAEPRDHRAGRAPSLARPGPAGRRGRADQDRP